MTAVPSRALPPRRGLASLLRSRLALRIYLVGLVQIAVIVIGFDFYVRRYTPHPPNPVHEQASYLAHQFEEALRRSQPIEPELATANALFVSEVALRDPDGRLIGGGGEGCARPGPQGPPPSCHIHPVVFPDGRLGQVEVTAWRAHPPPLLPSFIAFAMLVVGVGSWVFTWTLTRPLQRMCVAARTFGGGDLDARVGSKRRDELGELARGFDDMAERIQNLLTVERELMASVSHELRTPLARIRVALDLGHEGDATAMRDALGEISGDLDELERLIDDVLTTTRLDLTGPSSSGLGPLRLESIDVGELLEDVSRRFRGAHPSRPLVLEVPEESLRMTADPALLRRALSNLLDNAHKYTPDPKQPIELVSRESASIEIEVIDRGIGIHAQDLDSVFEPFFRADRSRSRATGGFGLGLALVKRIVEAHGGTVELTSEPNRGTRARVSLPTR